MTPRDILLTEKLYRRATDASSIADMLPFGDDRKKFERKAMEAIRAAEMNSWLTSPSLRKPQ